ncbi:Cas10/Cmr2 second palm domain-containing protein [Desulfobulbus propionicus]
MVKYFLRIEGVNLDNFVYDTNDLSTIRGGGWILLDAPGELVKHLQQQFASSPAIADISSITQGASWGLLDFRAENKDQAGRVATCARQFLSTWKMFSGATFVVDVLPAGEEREYPRVREQLTALNRWRQMQSPSLVVPQVVDKQHIPVIERKGRQQCITVCEFDHVSPACDQVRKGEDLAAGESVMIRRTLGKEKKRWYQKKTGLENFPDLVADFNELSELDDQKNPLNHKMAVIYLDGNGFGALQRKHCQTPAQQRHFDQKIRLEFQDGTLKVLLNEILAGPGWRNGQALRFETLLWGGDEIIWVVPAGKGWWLLARFFKEVAEKWGFPSKDNHLTLAAGLVFCHCKAPIQRIVHLAKRLGDLAKGDRTANRVAYQVLESFDHAGADVDGFRLRRCPAGILPHELVLNGNAMWPLLESGLITNLQQRLPKRQLHRLVEQLYLGGNPATHRQQQDDLVKSVMPEENQRQFLSNCLGSGSAQWLHLYELWDYLAEPVSSSQPTKEADHVAH